MSATMNERAIATAFRDADVLRGKTATYEVAHTRNGWFVLVYSSDRKSHDVFEVLRGDKRNANVRNLPGARRLVFRWLGTAR